MLPWLCNDFMNGAVHELRVRQAVSGVMLNLWGNRVDVHIFYADIVLVAELEEELDDMCRMRTLKVNVSRSQIVICESDGLLQCNTSLVGEELKV